MTSHDSGTALKLKIFSMEGKNRKPGFDTLEAQVNDWLAEHPSIVIQHTNELTQPNAAWSHLSFGVWYSQT